MHCARYSAAQAQLNNANTEPPRAAKQIKSQRTHFTTTKQRRTRLYLRQQRVVLGFQPPQLCIGERRRLAAARGGAARDHATLFEFGSVQGYHLVAVGAVQRQAPRLLGAVTNQRVAAGKGVQRAAYNI